MLSCRKKKKAAMSHHDLYNSYNIIKHINIKIWPIRATIANYGQVKKYFSKVQDYPIRSWKHSLPSTRKRQSIYRIRRPWPRTVVLWIRRRTTGTTAAVGGAAVRVLRRGTFGCAPPPSAIRLMWVCDRIEFTYTRRADDRVRNKCECVGKIS